MSIRFRCEQCGATGNAKEHLAGKILACPSCKAMMEIPGEQWAREDPPPPPLAPTAPSDAGGQDEELPRKAMRFTLRQMMLVTAGVAAAVTFLSTLRSESGLPHYVALVLLLNLIAWGVLGWAGKRDSKLYRGAAMAVIVAVVWIWAANDYYTVSWSQKVQGDMTRYLDWHHRWSGRKYYREVDSITKDGHWYARGGFSESGKLHGPWHRWVYGAESKQLWLSQGYKDGVLGPSIDVWYWYGEEITEGEWHLRNR